MSTQVGLWIDHRQAVVVALTDAEEELTLIISKVEKQLRRTGDSPLKGDYDIQQVPEEDNRQRTFTEQLNIYYAAVIACVREAEAIFIFGPGEAKNELQAQLAKANLSDRIVGVETADKLTKRQIAAIVRQHFSK